MAQGMYWYKDRWNNSTHVVVASSKSIAQWYVTSCSTWFKDPVFVEKRNRAASDFEALTVLAHPADNTLRRSIVELEANGCSTEYLARMKHLAKRLEPRFIDTLE
jgi:hypothetical protein